MKHLLLTVALLATSATAQVKLTESPDGDVWVAYPESFTQFADGVSMLVGLRQSGKAEVRSYLGIEYSTCRAGHGDLYYRHNTTDKWENMATVTLSSNQTVADDLAIVLCAGAAKLERKFNLNLSRYPNI